MKANLSQSPSVVSKQISFRTSDPDADERITRLLQHMKNLPTYVGVKLSASTVMDMALLRGLELLERELGVGSKPPKTQGKG